MHPITHNHARTRMRLGFAALAALGVALLPAAARAQVADIPAGHAAVAGTMSDGDTPCPTWHETATGAGVASDQAAGTYAGTFDITADGSSELCNRLIENGLDDGSFTVSVSGTSALGSIVCRQFGTPPGSGAPMTGLWFRIGEILILGADGVCNVNGTDEPHTQVWQTLVFAPTGFSTDTLTYSGGAVTGDLRIGE
jgi:hypothetical protein